MHWVKADRSDFSGDLPLPRSGHTAVLVGKSKVVVFGGFAEKRFLDDIAVYDIENKLWFTPDFARNGSDTQVGPSPRAFHVAVAIDCHMFIFGGRVGNRRLGDFWMLDTDIWQWSELTTYGDLPTPREFAAASAIENRKIIMYGGWDGKKWLSDVYVLDTMSLEWMELSITGSVPPPRCGHTATMVEKRLLIFGGRGGSGPIMGDLWALKGLFEEGEFTDRKINYNTKHQPHRQLIDDNETPGWTLLKLPGQAPSPRCGHTVTSGGHYLLLFGGHGTGGWLSRYDIYHNDCIVLDRVSVQWKRLPTNNEPPPPRAYHSMTCIGARYLLFGGFDGKSTFGDLWWLVPEDDPIAKRSIPQHILPESKPLTVSVSQSSLQDSQPEQSPILELQKRLGVSISSTKSHVDLIDDIDDKELLELSLRLAGESLPTRDQVACIHRLREHWKNSSATSVQLRELGPLLRDYQRLIVNYHVKNIASSSPSTAQNPGQSVHRFFHLKRASQLRMDDIPELLKEYQQLISSST